MICPRTGGRGHFWELLGREPARRAQPWHEQSSHLVSELEQHCSFPVWKDGKKAQRSPKHPSGHCFGGTAISSCTKSCKVWADSLSTAAAPHFLMDIRVQYPHPQAVTSSSPFGGCSKAFIVSCSDKGYKSHSNRRHGGGQQLLLTQLMTFHSYVQKKPGVFHLLPTSSLPSTITQQPAGTSLHLRRWMDLVDPSPSSSCPQDAGAPVHEHPCGSQTPKIPPNGKCKR